MARYEYDEYYSSYQVNVRDEIDNDEFVEMTEEEREEIRERLEERKREEQGRMRAIAAVYEKADRILTQDPVKVSLVDDPTAPSAWNDGQTISLNASILRNYDDSDIVSLHGVNYHEVCHILYSPRAGSEMGKWVIEKNYLIAFNVLEDQRIETLFAARYPSTRVFLEAVVLRYVMGLSDDESKVMPLIHGRRFINYALRQKAYDLFANEHGKDTARKVAEIIDEYRLLALPKDMARAKELIERFQLLMWRDQFQMQSPCAQRDVCKKGRPEPSSAQQRDGESAAKSGEQPVSGPKAGGEEKSEGTGAGNEDIDDDPSSYEQPSDAEKREATKDDWTLADMANSAMDELINRPEAHRETRDFRRAVRANEYVTSRIKPHNDVNLYEVHDNVRHASNKFGEILRQIEEEADPTWEYEVPSGKLNTNRAMHSDINDLNTLFDRWYEGDDATVIEAAILLDRSGSMCYRMDSANEASWAIKRGLEKIDARCTVYTFGNNSRMLYSADEKAAPTAYRRVEAGGGTNPLRALEETEMLMENSNRPTKIVFMVTDGMWDTEDQSNAIIDRMNDAGVLTVLVYIGNLEHYEQAAREGNEYAARTLRNLTHGAKVARAITDPKDLTTLAERVVTSHLTRKIAR